MTAEERAQAAFEKAAGGWRAYPNTYDAVVAAIRAAENEALERAAAYLEAQDAALDDGWCRDYAAQIRSLASSPNGGGR